MADIKLTLSTVPVTYADGSTDDATAEGNNAAWHCRCEGTPILLGRCYFQFGHSCHTVCAQCGRVYRVHRNRQKKTKAVEEVTG